MPRSLTEIGREAKANGQRAAKNRLSDNDVIQVLCALVEELADKVRKLESELQELKQRQPSA